MAQPPQRRPTPLNDGLQIFSGSKQQSLPIDVLTVVMSFLINREGIDLWDREEFTAFQVIKGLSMMVDDAFLSAACLIIDDWDESMITLDFLKHENEEESGEEPSAQDLDNFHINMVSRRLSLDPKSKLDIDLKEGSNPSLYTELIQRFLCISDGHGDNSSSSVDFQLGIRNLECLFGFGHPDNVISLLAGLGSIGENSSNGEEGAAAEVGIRLCSLFIDLPWALRFDASVKKMDYHRSLDSCLVKLDPSRLNELRVSGFRFTCSALSGFLALESLDIDLAANINSESDVRSLSSLQLLRKVSLSIPDAEEESSKVANTFSNCLFNFDLNAVLRELIFSSWSLLEDLKLTGGRNGVMDDASFSAVPADDTKGAHCSLSRLGKVNFINSDIGDGALKALVACSAPLVNLQLQGSKITNHGIAELGKMANPNTVKVLNCNMCNVGGGGGSSAADAAAREEEEALFGQGLEHHFSSLEELDLEYTYVSDRLMTKSVAGMPNLNHLHIADTSWIRKPQFLETLPSLTYLNVCQSKLWVGPAIRASIEKRGGFVMD